MGNTPLSSSEDPDQSPRRLPQEGEEVDTPFPAEFTQKYEVISRIGKGAFGSVYKVRDLKTKTVYAAKQVEFNESNQKEVQIQAAIDDSHVVRIFDTIVARADKQLFIVMEFCEGGSLMQWIKRNRRHKMLNEIVILHMLQEICKAVYNCHQKRIIHRDLKPENVLLDSRRRVKLADFGVARVLDRASVAKSFCGTPPYMAPELFLSYLSTGGEGATGYDNTCDVWSIGCILWDMANCKDLFIYQLGSNLGYDVAKASTDSMGAKEISERIEQDVPQEYQLTKRLLHKMLKRNPENRATLSEILQDTELRQALENPLGGHWSDIYDKMQ